MPIRYRLLALLLMPVVPFGVYLTWNVGPPNNVYKAVLFGVALAYVLGILKLVVEPMPRRLGRPTDGSILEALSDKAPHLIEQPLPDRVHGAMPKELGADWTEESVTGKLADKIASETEFANVFFGEIDSVTAFSDARFIEFANDLPTQLLSLRDSLAEHNDPEAARDEFDRVLRENTCWTEACENAASALATSLIKDGSDDSTIVSDLVEAGLSKRGAVATVRDARRDLKPPRVLDLTDEMYAIFPKDLAKYVEARKFVKKGARTVIKGRRGRTALVDSVYLAYLALRYPSAVVLIKRSSDPVLFVHAGKPRAVLMPIWDAD